MIERTIDRMQKQQHETKRDSDDTAADDGSGWDGERCGAKIHVYSALASASLSSTHPYSIHPVTVAATVTVTVEVLVACSPE